MSLGQASLYIPVMVQVIQHVKTTNVYVQYCIYIFLLIYCYHAHRGWQCPLPESYNTENALE